MNIDSNTQKVAREIVTVVYEDEKQVTITMSEREAKVLGCLIGAMSTKDAEDIIRNHSMYYESWLGKLNDREVLNFTTDLFDGLFNQF